MFPMVNKNAPPQILPGKGAGVERLGLGGMEMGVVMFKTGRKDLRTGLMLAVYSYETKATMDVTQGRPVAGCHNA